MRQVATIIVAAAVLAVPQAAAKEPLAPKTVFGVAWNNRKTSVAELDALTLRPVSKAIQLGKAGWYLGRSPGGGMRAAFAVGEHGDSIRFVDLAAMKPEKQVLLPCSISRPMLWETANRLVTTCGGSASSILVVDPVKQRLVSRKALAGNLFGVQAHNGLLVGLLAPLDGIGAARLIVVDGTGFTRSVALPAIRAGTQMLDQNTYSLRIQQPAVAIEPNGRRAAVVPASGAVAVVDLSSLAVTSHALRTLAAARKNIEGTERSAIWTWSGTIAVTGTDWAADAPHHATPAGLTLIDAETWTSRTLDPQGVSVSYTGLGGVLLSAGAVWDAATQKSIGHGLTAFGVDGTQRFHAFADDAVWIAALAGTYAYIADDGLTSFRIVDTMTGNVIATPHTAKPTTLAATQPTF